MSRFLKSPYLEITVIVGVLVLAYVSLALIASGLETPPGGMPGWSMAVTSNFSGKAASFGLVVGSSAS